MLKQKALSRDCTIVYTLFSPIGGLDRLAALWILDRRPDDPSISAPYPPCFHVFSAGSMGDDPRKEIGLIVHAQLIKKATINHG